MMEGSKVAFVLLLSFLGGVRKCHAEIATCNPTACKVAPCSSNVDCECLSLAGNDATAGICAALVLSCTSMIRCNPDNRTCPIEYTVCVSNTRCQHPVCYPLALADRQVCPSSMGTTTPAASTAEPIATICPVGQVSSITAESNQKINFNTQFPKCPSCVNVTVNSNGGIYNVCSTEELNITANSNGDVTMQQSSICPKRVNITVGGNANVYNVCVTQELNILAATGNNIISLQTHQASICPKIVNLAVKGNARVYNICASDQLTVLSATGNNIISMDYKQLSSCPKFVNILNGTGISVFYVCATQAINAQLSGIATLYYKGPLNHTVVTGLASIQKWI